jgi:hypothetical protein
MPGRLLDRIENTLELPVVVAKTKYRLLVEIVVSVVVLLALLIAFILHPYLTFMLVVLVLLGGYLYLFGGDSLA